jgi:hypothetical protein
MTTYLGNEGNFVLQIIGKYLPANKAYHPRRLKLEKTTVRNTNVLFLSPFLVDDTLGALGDISKN